MTGPGKRHSHGAHDASQQPTGHAHHHAHHHGGHHHHMPAGQQNRAFLISILLNVTFVIIEFVFGIMAHSTALIADAGHNLSDVLGLVLAWGASLLGQRRAGTRYTWGLGSASILAALTNAVLLIAACGAIAWEAVSRITEAPPVAGLTVSIVAGVGVVINGISAWLLMSGTKGDINMRGAFLHMLADAAVSFGVVIVGIGILLTQWYWLDPAVTLAIVVAILWASWGLLRESLRLSLNAVPAGIDLDAVNAYLENLPGVTEVQDLHVWAVSTTQTALAAHIIMPAARPDDTFLDVTCLELKERFGIDHSTLQVMRSSSAPACALNRQGPLD
jgi:cobalt-zinc-cadmium efflux system protein